MHSAWIDVIFQYFLRIFLAELDVKIQVFSYDDSLSIGLKLMMAMLKVVYSNDMKTLAAKLAEQQQTSPLPPLEAETVIVQSNELARWLSLYLAQAQGIACHINYPFPSAFIWSLFRQVLPDVPQNPAYEKEALTWRIFELLPHCRHLPEFTQIHHYLGASKSEVKIFNLAARLADTFDQYLMYRPQWIQQWESGESPHWQARLWQRITAGETRPKHRVNLLHSLIRRLESGTPVENLPARISLFGISALPPIYLELFSLLARYCTVTIYFQSPSPEYWGDLRSRRVTTRQEEYDRIGHPLLASLGKQGQEFFELLQHYQPVEEAAYIPPEPDTLLGQLQRDIFDLQAVSERREKSVISQADDSIRFHVCHSPLREVEVLYDQLLDLFERHPELSPTDVVVMAPDIEAYAPWIDAVFGQAPAERAIPYGIAGSHRPVNSSILAAFKQILRLPQSRFDVAFIVSLLECEAVQRRWGLDAGQLDLIQYYLRETHIHWGLSARHKQELGLPASPRYTWRAGLDRMLLGYAIPLQNPDKRLPVFSDIPGIDGVNGDRAETVAKLCAFIDQLATLKEQLQTEQDPEHWARDLNRVLDALFLPAADQDSEIYQCTLIRQSLALMAETASHASLSQPLAIETVATWLDNHLDDPAASSRFLGQGVTFCGMVPMRSIPFSVVCLMGMNDGEFPRQQPAVGFDLLADPKQFRAGDRSRREDDRYLFLEALLSAQSHLYISYTGASIADNAPIPPSVLVSELLDTLQDYFLGEGGANLASQLIIQHPLQAFSPRYFNQSESRLFSYQDEYCPANTSNSSAVKAWNVVPLPEADAQWRQVSLSQLLEFFRHPARYFCEQRLGLRIDRQTQALEDREPFALTALEGWQVQQDMLTHYLNGEDETALWPYLSACGVFPDGLIGQQAFKQVQQQVQQFSERLPEEIREHTPHIHAFNIQLDDAFTLTGQLRLYPPATQIAYYFATQIHGGHMLEAWIRHLILHCVNDGGDTPCITEIITEQNHYQFLPVTDARAQLMALMQLYWQGLHDVLPLFPKSSFAYAKAHFSSRKSDPDSAARKAWEGGMYARGEAEDRYFQQCFPHGISPLNEAFRQLTCQVYTPLVAHLDGGQL